MGSANSRIEVYLGSSIEDPTELKFLSRLRHAFGVVGTPAVILANFHAGPRRRQVDFVVATEHHAAVVEIKGYKLPVRGKPNGPWSSVRSDGSLRQINGQSPYDQTISNRFAVSDGLAKFLADGLDARTCVSGMLCLYPAPPYGSQIPPSDHKVSIGGWSEFELLLSTPSARPLSLDQWRGFAESLGLVSEGTEAFAEPAGIVAEYRAHMLELSAAVDGPFQPPTFEVDRDADAPDIAALVDEGRQPFLLGPSGVGKTRLLAEISSATARSGRVPITIRAREFGGDLAPLLRKAVAIGTAVSPQSLLAAARESGAGIILCVDALNECRPGLLPRLIAVLQAFRLRYDALVVMSAQADTELPPLLDGPRLKLLQPGRERAAELVSAHLGRALADGEESALDLVATAQDAAVLAGLLSKSGSTDGRYQLYDQFTRNLLPREKQASLHAGLAGIATAIRAELRPLIATSTARRVLWRASPDCDPDLLEAVLTDGRLLASEGGHTRFRHDLFADFFAATDLLGRAGDDNTLIDEALRPFNAELREFLVGGAGRGVQDALLRSPAAPRLLAGVLRGRGGQGLRRHTLARCQDLLDRMAKHIGTLTFALPEREGDERPHYLETHFADEFELAASDSMLWHALPVAAEEGLLGPILDFAGLVDKQIGIEVARLRLKHPEIRIFNHLAYITIHGAWSAGTELGMLRSLVSDCQNRFGEIEVVQLPVQLADELDRFEEKSTTQLLVLFAILRGCWQQLPRLPARMVELLAHAWERRVYHLRLLTTDMIYFNGRHFEPELKAELAELLQNYLGEDAMQNTFIFDALKAIDAVDFELDIDTIVDEYTWIAEQPIDDDISNRAMSAYYSTWDHPDPGPYYEAFYDRLTDEVRGAVLIRALSSTGRDTMSLDFALRELPEPLAEAAIAIVEQFAGLPIEQSSSEQSSVALFAAACAKLARSGLPLPPADAPTTTTSMPELAWRRMAPILHALNQDTAPARAKLDELWSAFARTGAAAAVDALSRTSSDAPLFKTRAMVNFIDHFPHQMRSLAIDVLDAAYVPESYFPIHNHRNAEELLRSHRVYALTVLGAVGKPADTMLLRSWMDDGQLGETALASARRLESRTL